MSKAVTNQILISVVATVAAGILLEWLRPKLTPPPVAYDDGRDRYAWGV